MPGDGLGGRVSHPLYAVLWMSCAAEAFYRGNLLKVAAMRSWNSS